MSEVRSIGREAMAELAAQAEAAARKRSHLLLHGGHADPVQRLLIMMQPGTYVRPHQHSEQWEMLILQQGHLDVLVFTEQGRLQKRVELSPAAPIIEIPLGTWHGAIVLEPRTAVMEIKPGPYRANEFAPWAPEEGDPNAARFVEWATSAETGSDW